MITSYTQLLARDYASNLDEQAQNFITVIIDGTRRMQTLINDLLGYSRLGTHGESFTAVDCNAVVASVLSNLQLSIQEAEAVVHTGPLPTVHGDKSQLTQLFQNLLSNALKFRGPSRPEIAITAEFTAPNWVFAVRDNGIGIDPKFHERIFVIFQRLHRRERYAGTGIGLAICKRVVERHGGRIWVESTPGAGAIFRFTLPDAAPAEAGAHI